MSGFPIMLTAAQRAGLPNCPASVPLALVEPHAALAQKLYGGTLAELSDAGGLDPVELLALLDGRKFPADEFVKRPAEMIAAAAREVTRRAAQWLNATGKPAAVARPALVWECVLCASDNIGRGPGLAQCRFCKTVHSVTDPTDEADEGAAGEEEQAGPPALDRGEADHRGA